jgi:hypothetical protein
MPLIFNTTNEVQKTKALGNWFEFKPKQIKSMSDNIGNFLATERAELGLVALPEELEDAEFRASAEGKAILEAKEQQGIDTYVKALRATIYNNQVSLRQDLEKSNLKIDPAALASEGELVAMRIVASYQAKKDDADQKRIDEVKELIKKTGTGTR